MTGGEDELRQGITPPSDAELASWRELPPGTGELADQGARPADARAAEVLPVQPGIVPPNAKAIQLGLNAFERALGVRPLLIRTGGSLPIVSAFADKGIATIITGFALPNANLHSPNERLLAEYVPRGIAAGVPRDLRHA